MLSSYIMIYQFIDNEERKLVEQIDALQSRILYRDLRQASVEECDELYVLKIKLDFLRMVGSKLLKMFIEYDNI